MGESSLVNIFLSLVNIRTLLELGRLHEAKSSFLSVGVIGIWGGMLVCEAAAVLMFSTPGPLGHPDISTFL